MTSRNQTFVSENPTISGSLTHRSIPAPATGPLLREQTATVDSCRISYRIGGKGPCLLLLHGFTLNGSQWDPFLARLAQNHTVIVPDLPGHGLSGAEDGPFSFVRTARRMHALLRHLGIHTFACLGHSAGAVTALHMASQSPSSVDAMVLIAGPHRLDAQARSMASDERFDALDAQMQGYYYSLHPGGRAQINRIFQQFNQLGKDGGDFDLSDASLNDVSAPALLVWGDHDPYFTLESGLALFRVLPNAQMMVWPGQGHTPVWESMGGSRQAAESFSCVLETFLAQVGEAP